MVPYVLCQIGSTVTVLVAILLLTRSVLGGSSSPEETILICSFLVIVSLVCFFGTVHFSRSIRRQREIRLYISLLVDILEYRLTNLAVNDHHVFGNQTDGLIKATRRGHQNWQVEAFGPGDELEAQPRFEFVILKHRMHEVDNPDALVKYGEGSLFLARRIHDVINSGVDYAEFVKNMSPKKRTAVTLVH